MNIPCQLFEEIEQTVEEDGVRWNQYRAADGSVLRFQDLPFGAMFINRDCTYTGCVGAERGGCLYVKIPSRADHNDDGQFWQPDHPAGGTTTPWTRSGEPPNVTAMPSILNFGPGGYHGWLRDGQLVDV